MTPLTRKRLKWLAVPAGLLVLGVLQIDDWGRDLRSHEAAITEGSTDPALRPFRSPRSTDQLILGVRAAATRIRNWEYTGEARDGGTVSLMFVRTHRLLRIRDDILIRVEDRGDHRLVSGISTSRLEVADLGRNPRNLKRLLAELRTVLEGAIPPEAQRVS